MSKTTKLSHILKSIKTQDQDTVNKDLRIIFVKLIDYSNEQPGAHSSRLLMV
jgi:hypothetical protein